MLDSVKPSFNSWPADQVERRAVAGLVPYARNARTHSDEQVAQIAASIREWGWTQPVLVDEAGMIIAGHGRVLAAARLGIEDVPVAVARGWSDAKKRAYVIADNKLAENSGWDDATLKLELRDLRDIFDFDLGLAGFDEDELSKLFAEVTPEGDRAAMLKLVDVTIADPHHQVESGDRWLLSDRHHLICVGIMREWAAWQPFLKPGVLFCPYPGVFVPFGERAKDHTLLMVQPDTYIAGHILDRYAEVHGEPAVQKVAA
jgi:hypothetical protein